MLPSVGNRSRFDCLLFADCINIHVNFWVCAGILQLTHDYSVVLSLDLCTGDAADTPVTSWTHEQLLCRLVALGVKVKEIHRSVCCSLTQRYSGGVTSRDDEGAGPVSEEHVIQQFNAVRPLYEQLEQVKVTA